MAQTPCLQRRDSSRGSSVRRAKLNGNMLRRIAILLSALSLHAADLSPGRKYTTIERLDPAHLEATHQAREHFAKDRKKLPWQGVYTD